MRMVIRHVVFTIGWGAYFFTTAFALAMLDKYLAVDPRISNALVTFCVITTLIPYVYLIIVNWIKRLHDIGVSGWLLPVFFIPPIGVLLIILPGRGVQNKYGLPNK